MQQMIKEFQLGMVAYACLLRRLRQENCLNPGGGGCGELRSRHCTSAWVTRAKLCLKNKKSTWAEDEVTHWKDTRLHVMLPVAALGNCLSANAQTLLVSLELHLLNLTNAQN